MLFQEIQDSPWLITFGVLSPAFTLVMWVILGLASVAKNTLALDLRTLRRRFLGAVACALGCALVCTVGLFVAMNHQRDQLNASFSKQLLDEYHATSSRSFYSINYDLGPSSGATAVFTRDGKDTPVFIRLINRDGKNITMTFTKLDDQSLYPTASK